MYINTASPTPQGLVQRFKANGIQCERVKTCIHLCIHIYMYIYIQVHKKSRHGNHLYIYLNIHTQANSCTPGKVYGRVYIYIYVCGQQVLRTSAPAGPLLRSAAVAIAAMASCRYGQLCRCGCHRGASSPTEVCR